MRAVALLSAFKFKNSLRTLFSDPRKLLPLAVAIALVALMIVLGQIGINQPHPNASHEHLDPRAFHAGVLLSLILLGLSFIDSGLGDSLLTFGMSDVDYLFPSPIPRRVVLAFRLPGLMFGALFMAGFVLMAFDLAMRVAEPKWQHVGHTTPPGWAAPAALFLSGGIYMNLAMFISVRMNNRKMIHRALMVSVFVVAGLLGLVGWRLGANTVEAAVLSKVVWWLFLPASLATESLLAGYAKEPSLAPLGWLAVSYALSLIPMFTAKANWYEQSIVSTERSFAFRQAARGGYASLMGAKASSLKSTRSRMYTLKPFGSGAMSLFWAHLCAAAKRPFGNFIGPVFGGILAGSFAAFAASANKDTETIGLGALFAIGLYCSMGFLATAKAACESAIRRRELLSPLPFPGWQSVAANLGTPYCTIILFFSGCGITYALFRAPYWPLVSFAFGVGLPLRLSARMILQYIIGIAYPDAADKLQQFFAVGVYAIATSPFLVAEFIICLPGMILHSFWIVAISLTLIQIPIGAVLLLLAGKASEKAVATGEPVSVMSVVRRNR